VRSGNPGSLSADIAEGHRSATPCHLGSLSLGLGRTAEAAEIHGFLEDLPILGEAFARMASHLKANQVDLKSTPITLGRHLVAEGSSLPEALAADPATAPLLFRPGRAPFRFPSG